MNTKLEQLEKRLNLKFKNQQLLENVFIHRSYLNEHKNFYLPSNEKLEFLGDSVLSLITSIYLYKNYPELQEGDYTDIKSSIVCTDSLFEAAKRLKLGDYLYLSKGENKSGGRNNTNIIADSYEALIAAIFFDFGFDRAYQFVSDTLFLNNLNYIVQNKLYLAPKTRLQEYVQAKYKIIPVYKVIETAGPEHSKTFKIEVMIHGKKYGTGSGKSKKDAEELAAKKALEKIESLV